MKLELKHLAPYLPYGLKYKGKYGGVSTLRKLEYYRPYNKETDSYSDEIGVDGYLIQYIKPILRPLSDLNKAKIFDNYGDEKLTAIEEFEGNWDLGALDWVLLEVSKGNQVERLLELSYLVIEKLIEHHFDIFGLIEAGLAIDINTLKDE